MEIIKEIKYSSYAGKTQYDDNDNDMVRVFVDMKKGELRKFKRMIKANGIKPELCDVLAEISLEEYTDYVLVVPMAHVEEVLSKYFA